MITVQNIVVSDSLEFFFVREAYVGHNSSFVFRDDVMLCVMF